MKRKLKHLTTGIVVILIGLVLFFIAIDFRWKLEDQLDKQAKDILARSAEMISEVVDKEFKEQFARLESIASLFGIDDYTDQQIIAILNYFDVNNIAHRLTYTDITGRSISIDGFDFNISDRDYFKETIEKGQSIAFIDESYVDQQSKLILSRAIYDQDGLTIGMISSIYNEDSFYTLFEKMELENFILLTDQNGDVMVSINRYDETIKIDNVFGHFKTTSTYDEAMETSIHNNIIAKLADIIVIGQGESRHYISYFNVEGTQWMIFTAVPYSAIWSQFNEIGNISLHLFLQILLVFVIIVLLVYYFEYKKREELENERKLLRRSEERYRVLDELKQSMVLEGDFESDTITFSSNQETIFGYRPSTKRISDYLTNNPYIVAEDLDKIKAFIDKLKGGADSAMIDCRLISKDDITFWTTVTGMPMRDHNGKVIGFIAKVTNRDEQVKQMLLLKDAATKDSLTKIDNRESIELKVNEYVNSRFNQPEISAFFVLDMDNFKDVNDKQGHLIGDKLLIDIAQLLSKMFRKTDYVGRLGGDEFAVFMNDVKSTKDIEDKANDLLRGINETIDLYSFDSNLSCSIGIAITYDNLERFNELYTRADIVLYRSKENGKNQFFIDDPKKGDNND